MLLQEQNDGKLHPVSFGSWLFNPAQRRYPTQWREFYGRKFTAETDHKGLEGYLNLEDPYGKVARWHSELSQFNYSLAEFQNDSLEYEIENVPQEIVCPTSVQRLTLPNDDKRAKEILSDAKLFAIMPENKILYRVVDVFH